MVDELVNPYIAGAPVTEARMFFGREDVFDWIQNSLVGRYADHILVIHGQRRVGKTSVLKQLGNRLPTRYIPVFFDLQGRTHTTLDRFLWWLAREIVRVLKQERGIEIPLPEKEAFSADLEYFENHFLPGLHTSLDGSTLLLTFDEFDNLEESEIKEVLGRPLIDYLRRMMGNKDLNFIFSIGSSGRKLENMQASYTDFFKTALYKKISFLNEEQTHKLVTQPVDGILEYDRPATNCIFRIAGGHPYFTQLTCHELFARCQRTDQRQIREADVEAILDDVVERGTVNLKFVWDEASDIEKWALASLASLDKPDNRTLAAYLRKQNLRFSESDLTSGLLHLREKDILTPENHFVIYLLKLWLQKNRPIEQVREELTEVNPIANRYIEIGLEFKSSGQYQKAIESFQEALTVSAGSIQAQVSIALVYMDQKAYDKAVGEFEKALAIDDEDITARSGLCDAHLALGVTAMQKGRWKEAAQSYQRVLGINEEHNEARQRLAEVHRQRAEKALADGRDEEALSAFAEAMKYAPKDESLSARAEAIRAEKKAKVTAAQIARSEKEAGANNWEAAVRTLEEAKKFAPDNPNIQKRLDEVREKFRANKLVALRIKAQGAVKAEKFGEALKTWQEYLSLEPDDRNNAEEEIERLKKSQELEDVYNKAQQAISDKSYDKAISLLKEVIVRDENFKDTSRLLVQAIELRRSSRPARFTPFFYSILKGLLITIGVVGFGIGAYFAWDQWGGNIGSNLIYPITVTTPSTGTVIPETTQPSVAPPTATAPIPPPALGATQVPIESIVEYLSILDHITNTLPDFKDNFLITNSSWDPIAEGISTAELLKDARLDLQLDAGTPKEKFVLSSEAMRATDFALEFDFFFEDGTGGTTLGAGFPSTGKDSETNLDVNIDLENQKWYIGLTDRTMENSGEITESLKGKWAHLQIVFFDTQVGFFLNDSFLGNAEGIDHSRNEIWIYAATGGQGHIKIDNFKFWNLDNAKLGQ